MAKKLYRASHQIADVAGASQAPRLQEMGHVTSVTGYGVATSRSPLRAAQRARAIALAQYNKNLKGTTEDITSVLDDTHIDVVGDPSIYGIVEYDGRITWSKRISV